MAQIKFKDVPAGGRIKAHGKTWVVIESYGDGLLQEYTGENSAFLSRCSWVDKFAGITLDTEVNFIG